MVDKKDVEEWIKFITEGLNGVEEFLVYNGYNEMDKILILQILLDMHLKLISEYKNQSKKEIMKEVNDVKKILMENFLGVKVY
jgi:hypothetical protein